MKAFSRAAPITDKNFPDNEQKQFIMDGIFKAASIYDEDILTYTFEALNDIVKVNYDYLVQDDIMNIGQYTINMVSSQFEKVAKLSIEVWTSIAEVEIDRNSKGIRHNDIIKTF